MAESLRDMVVSLSLNGDNFTRNLKSISAQMKEAESEFKLAGAGVEGFEKTTAGAQAQLQALQQKFQLQQQAVSQYEKALTAAQQKLQSSVNAHEQLSSKLEEAKQKNTDLKAQVEQATAAYERYRKELGEDDSATIAAKENLDALKEEYKASSQEVQNLETQLSRNEAAMQRNADGVTRAQTNLNAAQAALRETGAQIDSVSQRLHQMQSHWVQAANGLAAFGDKAISVGKSIEGIGKKMSVVSAAVVATGAKTVKTFASYDDSIRQVYATMGLSESENAAEMTALSDAAKEMGATTKYTASEAASALNYLALAGYDSEKAIAALPQVLNLAQAGGIDLASASDMITDSMSALGLEMSYMPTFADQMAKASQKSNTSVAQLGEGILKVSATAKNLKGGTVELNTALGIMADNGIKGAEGGTHLRNVILSLQNPTKDAQEMLDKFGISVYDSQGNMRGLNEIMLDLNNAMAGMNQAGKDATVSTIFNKTDLTAVNALLANSGARWNELSGYISDCDGAASQMADTMEGGIGGAFRSLGSAVESLMIAFGETLAPTIQAIAEKITGYVRAFSQMDEAHKQTIVKIAAVVAAAGPVVLVIGKIVTSVGVLAKAVSKGMLAITKLPATIGKITAFFSKIPATFTSVTTAISGFATKSVAAVKTFGASVTAAGGGLKGLLAVVGSSPVAIAAFAAAAAYGLYKLYDWASGAKAAREAQARLNETVEEFGENVTTAFEKSEGLSKFNLSAEDFSIKDSGGDWLAQTLATWTDGKKETDEIVSDTVKGFTDGTDQIRTALQSLKDSTGGTVVGDMDKDLADLDAIDKEVESILKKKQNGYLSDDETKRLQELIDKRDAISVKYHLVSDTGDAFQSITDGVEAAMSRGADGTQTFTDAFAAATQGLGAFTDSLNAEYDARYQVIQAMENSAEKEAAMQQLTDWYNQQKTLAVQQYAETLTSISEQTGAFDEGSKFDQTAQKLAEINQLMSEAAGKDANSEEMTRLREAMADLNETDLTELDAAIGAMETACADAGVAVPENIQKMSDALTAVKAAATDTSNVFSEDVAASINTMFAGLSEETHEVFATLNCDNLSTAYDAWAAGGHADIIPTLDTNPLNNGETLTLDATAPVELTGLPETIELSATAPVTLTGLPETIELSATAPVQLTGLPDTISVKADAPVALSGVPETITVQADAPVKISGLPEGDLIIPAGAPVTLHDVPENITVQCDSPVQLSGVPDSLKVQCDSPVQLSGVPDSLNVQCDSPVQLSGVPDSITVQCEAPVSLTGVPEVIEVAGKVNFDQQQFSTSGRTDLEFTAGSTKMNAGGNSWITESDAERVIAYANAIEQLNDAQSRLNSAEGGSDEWFVANADVEAALSVLGQYQTAIADFGTNGETAGAAAQYIANGLQQMADGTITPEDAAALEQFMTALQTIGNDANNGGVADGLLSGIADELANYGWETSAGTVLENLQSAFSSAQASYQQVGQYVSAGVGQGESQYDFSGDAAAASDHNLQANNSANGIASPAAKFLPVGQYIAAGIGEGMKQYSFAGDAASLGASILGAVGTAALAARGIAPLQGFMVVSGIGQGMTTYPFASSAASVAAKIKSALSSSLTSSTFSPIGKNAMAGLAQGIKNGTSSVTSAIRTAARKAVAAAKSELVIKSPSHVFRDEVGVMVMKGFGEGVREESNRQAKVIRNAARFLTGEAQGGVIGTGSSDNRRTYNQQSTVNLSVGSMTIHDKQDIQALAREIAVLTKRRQTGYGS